MAQVFHYSTPTTPAGAGSDTVISSAVQISPSHSFTESAALGEAPVVSVSVDDPNAAYDFKGLKRWYVVEDQCPAGDQLIWNGYINDQHVNRGDGTESSLFPFSSGRYWTLELEEMNSILGFRIISDADGNRPAETAEDRLNWLMNDSDYLTTVGDNGLVNFGGLGAFNMDANDYRGQTAQDVLSDIAVQSGFLFFAFYDKDADDDQRLSLFFDEPGATTYTSDIQISNFGDADGTTIYAPYETAELSRSPSRVAAGVYLPYSGGAVYEYDLATSYEFGFRDRLAPMASVKTEALATQLADRFLSENSEQTDFVTTGIRMAAAHLNDVKRGQTLQARFEHFPAPYNDWFIYRVTRKTWAPPANRTQAFYDVELELSPINAGQPSGATDTSTIGVSYSGQPHLPTPTVPGHVLLMLAVGAGQVTKFPAEVRMKDDPAVFPASPEVPPFADQAGWTQIGSYATADFTGMNIGGPTAGLGLLVGAFTRDVQPAETTTEPVQVSTDLLNSTCAAWLWQLPAGSTFVGVSSFTNTHTTNPGHFAFGSSTGNLVGLFAFCQEDYGNPPYSITPDSGNTIVQSNAQNNNPATSPTIVDDTSLHGWRTPWMVVAQSKDGGVVGVTIQAISAYTSLNACGVLIRLPDGVELPNIPYPSNQVTGT